MTRLLRYLHWLPVAAHIRFKTGLAFKAINGAAPVYLQTPVRSHALKRALRSCTSAGQVVPLSLRANKARSAKSRLHSVLVMMVVTVALMVMMERVMMVVTVEEQSDVG